MVEELLPPLNDIIFQYLDVLDWDAMQYFRSDEPSIDTISYSAEGANMDISCRGTTFRFGYDKDSHIEFTWIPSYLVVEYHQVVIKYDGYDYMLLHYLYGNVIVKFQKGIINIFTSDEKRPTIPDIIPKELKDIFERETNISIDEHIANTHKFLNVYQDLRDPTHEIRDKYIQYHRRGIVDLFDWYKNPNMPFVKELTKI